MPNFYLRYLCSLLLISVPVPSIAISSIKDADAVITIRNGNPCFSYPQENEIQRGTYLFSYMSVSKNGPTGGAGWEIDIANLGKKGLLNPDTPETCIEYGVLNQGMKEKQVASPILPDTPYKVFIRATEVPGGRSMDSRKFLSDFCISKNKNGEPIIVGATGDGKGVWRCLKPGESAKRGFWQKLFGN